METCTVEGCHRQLKYVTKGLCRAHYQAWRYKNLPSDKDRQRRNAKAYRKANADKVRAYGAEWKLRNQRKVRGFSSELISALRSLQAGRCAICKRIMRPGNGHDAEHADHCHNTMTARGLLCSTCNRALGNYEKYQRPSGLRLEPYDAYLANPPARQVPTTSISFEI